jgi:hypothetical protein
MRVPGSELLTFAYGNGVIDKVLIHRRHCLPDSSAHFDICKSTMVLDASRCRPCWMQSDANWGQQAAQHGGLALSLDAVVHLIRNLELTMHTGRCLETCARASSYCCILLLLHDLDQVMRQQ